MRRGEKGGEWEVCEGLEREIMGEEVIPEVLRKWGERGLIVGGVSGD